MPEPAADGGAIIVAPPGGGSRAAGSPGYSGLLESDVTWIGPWITPRIRSGFAARRLTLGDAAYARCMNDLYGRGVRLEQSLVAPIFGRADALCSPGSPGAWRPYGDRLPMVLLFGYEIGTMIHSSLSVGYGRRPDVARMSALFNLGIALFDRACDRGSGASLAASLDEPRLRLFIDGDPRARHGWGPPADAGEGLDVLLGVVLAFFSDLHASTVVARQSRAWLALADLLIEAYRAEMLSGGLVDGPTSHDALLAAATRKSVAPFEVMLHIALVCEQHVGVAGVDDAARLADHLGVVFSVCDDLVDLERDLRSGDLNTIALGAGLRPRRFDAEAPEGRVASTASLRDCVGSSLEALYDHLDQAIELLESFGPAGPGVVARPARELLLAYVREWTDPVAGWASPLS